MTSALSSPAAATSTSTPSKAVDVSNLGIDPNVPWFDEMSDIAEEILSSPDPSIHDQYLLARAVLEISTARRGSIACHLVEIEGDQHRDTPTERFVSLVVFDPTGPGGQVTRFNHSDHIFTGCRDIVTASQRLFGLIQRTCSGRNSSAA